MLHALAFSAEMGVTLRPSKTR